MAAPRRPGIETALGDHEQRIRTLERQITSTTMPWVSVEADLNGTTINTGDNYAIPYTTLRIFPSGGSVDPSIYTDQDGDPITSGGMPIDSVWIQEAGLYLCVCSVNWYQDWGSCHTFIRKAEGGATPGALGSGDVDARALLGDLNLLPAFYIGFTGRSHVSIKAIHYRIYAVDKDPDQIKINHVVNNGGGTNRTFTNGAGGSPGDTTLTIIRLSPFGASFGT